jgi:hypothetical protein
MRDHHVRLTDEEQRRLDALEAALAAEDPDLARRLRSGRRLPVLGCVLAGPPARGLIGSGLVTAGALLVLFTLMTSTALAIGGCVAIAAGGYLTLTSGRVVRALNRFDCWLRPRLARSNERRSSS